MLRLSKPYILLMLLILTTCLCFGQRRVIEKIEEFESEMGTPVKLGYIQTQSGTDVAPLKNRLPPETFPLVVIKKADFEAKVLLIRKLQVESMEYARLARENAYLDSLQVLEDQAFEKVIEAERQRADLHKRTNQELITEIDRLSTQIDRTIDVGEKSLKGRNIKLLTTGILGGAIGLTTGLLVGVLSFGS